MDKEKMSHGVICVGSFWFSISTVPFILPCLFGRGWGVDFWTLRMLVTLSLGLSMIACLIDRRYWALALLPLVVVFNPVVPFHLERGAWIGMDWLATLALIGVQVQICKRNKLLWYADK